MKHLIILLICLLAFSSMAQAQFKAKPAAHDAPSEEYVGTFTAHFGFFTLTGVNIDELTQPEVLIKRGLDDHSFISIGFTTPEHSTNGQLISIGYGALISRPVESLWLLFNASALYKFGNPQQRNFVGLAISPELKYDFTAGVGISLKADVIPAYNFDQLGLAISGRAGVDITP